MLNALDDSDEESADAPRAKRRRAAEKAAMGADEQIEEGIESIENLEDTKGYTTKEWVSMLGPRTEISNRYKGSVKALMSIYLKLFKYYIYFNHSRIGTYALFIFTLKDFVFYFFILYATMVCL